MTKYLAAICITLVLASSAVMASESGGYGGHSGKGNGGNGGHSAQPAPAPSPVGSKGPGCIRTADGTSCLTIERVSLTSLVCKRTADWLNDPRLNLNGIFSEQ